ncbi:MAG: alpha/beta hydrolase [Chlorobi bacterium]|nr:alpha/beta hydrolase [Chlorobiota bacterium]
MIKKCFIFLPVFVMLFSFETVSQTKVLYKQIDTIKLYMEVINSPDTVISEKCPAMVFFFGGGWNVGNTHQFIHHAKYFADRGIVCFLVDYRVKKRNGTTPFESLKDAKSAIRFVRQNADEFGISPDSIIASGGSAGGHLAAATALIKDYNESTDDTTVSCVPDALVLFNPVIDNGPGGYGYDRVGEAYKDFSPLHNIQKGAPPTIFFLGTEDELIPVVTAEYYKMVMEKVGSRCDLKLYEGQGHGFFNYRNREVYNSTVKEAEEFLRSLGYLK